VGHWYASNASMTLATVSATIPVFLTVRAAGTDVEICKSLWPPCAADADIIFRVVVYSSSFFFFSSPILSGRRLGVYHNTSTQDVALVRV